MCKVTIIHKSIKSQCSFFVVATNSPALLGMPNCERLQMLNCATIEADHHRGQANEQYKQGKSKTNENSKMNPTLNGKKTQETDYFLAGPENEINIVASAKIKKEMHDIYVMRWWVIWNVNLYMTVSQVFLTYSYHVHYNLKENKTWILRLCIYKMTYILSNSKIYIVQW